MKRALKLSVLHCILMTAVSYTAAQVQPVSRYGMEYISGIPQFEKSIKGHPDKVMISLTKIPGIIIDLKYATDDNFMHKKLYSGNPSTTFLRQPAFLALDSVAAEMAKLGLALVVWDAYRPYSVTVELWERVKDERYSANPAKGSGHNRGLSVDLTLADMKNHKLLEMPTTFDDFTDSAHQDFSKLSKKAISNRDLLRKTMKKYGFVTLFSEWWHYSWPQTGDFEVLDLNFDQIQSLDK